MKPILRLCLALVGIFGVAALGLFFLTRPPEGEGEETQNPSAPTDVLSSFDSLLGDKGDDEVAKAGLEYLDKNWEPGFVCMLNETFRLPVSLETRDRVQQLLTSRTGRDLPLGNPRQQFEWLKWVWNQPYEPAKEYVPFKSWLYGHLDERFAGYFKEPLKTEIRLDEVMWGGVRQDGIPPLDNPQVVAADKADYMDDTNVVFGVAFNGVARAYPKRILGVHEMVRDIVGGVSINGVYCTLCNSMIVYDTEIEGQHYHLGTSGFLYRSNKLMFDKKTQSLWSTIEGKPVLGVLTGSGLQLKRLPVVTTTWGQWRRRHPKTDVLSLQTGHQRNYDEGHAYAAYYSTDELMFPVPKTDNRMKNKDQVLALRFGDSDQLAIDARFLAANPIFHADLSGTRFVVVTDESGANRVYNAGETTFSKRRGDKLVDETGSEWTLTEYELSNGDQTLKRLPAHRVFWFAWYSVYPDSKLILADNADQ